MDATKNWVINHTIYLRFLKNRMIDDDVGVLASSLSFTTIMSLVPVLAVLLSIFSMFPSFIDLKERMMAYIMQHLMPQMGDVVNEHINSFIDHASNTTIIGLLSLVVISLMLFRRVDLTMNTIWHTSPKSRSKVLTFSVYWTVLTLGPSANASPKLSRANRLNSRQNGKARPNARKFLTTVQKCASRGVSFSSASRANSSF